MNRAIRPANLADHDATSVVNTRRYHGIADAGQREPQHVEAYSHVAD